MNALASVVARLVSGRLDFESLATEQLTASEVAALKEIASSFRVSPTQLAARLRETVVANDWAEAGPSSVAVEAGS